MTSERRDTTPQQQVKRSFDRRMWLISFGYDITEKAPECGCAQTVEAPTETSTQTKTTEQKKAA